jgi:SAM-dependent methyltransferase
MTTMKNIIRKIPVLRRVLRQPFTNSVDYWIKRYKTGGNSGAGSYNRLAEFKAEVVNSFVKNNNVQTVIEFGCGDGNQLKYLDIPHYLGYDVSPDAVEYCKKVFNVERERERERERDRF